MRYFSMFFLLMLMNSIAYGAEERAKRNVINIKVVTEDTFPLQYLENGKITGPATRLVEQVLFAAGVTYHIEVLPWARAYQLALTEPNILIYSLAKTTARLSEFKWVGRIMALDYYLYGAADSAINLHSSLEELKQYEIGTVRYSAVDQYLRDNGFKKLTTVVHGKQNVLLFQQHRVDLFPANKSTFHAICLQDAFNCHNLKPLYKLDISSLELYIAFSQLTDDTLVEKIRASYTKIMKKRNNSYDIGIN